MPGEEILSGDEEETGEHVSEREDVAQALVAIVRLRDHEAGQEGAQGERETESGSHPSHGKTDDEDREQKEFSAARTGDLERFIDLTPPSARWSSR